MAPKKKTNGRAKTSPRRAKPEPKARRTKWSSTRRNTHPSNGSLPASEAVAPEPVELVSVGEAMRQAVEALGPVKIDAELSINQMQQLSDAYEEVTRAQAAFNAKAEAAKTAKKSLESATNLLLEKVKRFTHPAPLPLFDSVESEEELDDMLNPKNGELDAADV